MTVRHPLLALIAALSWGFLALATAQAQGASMRVHIADTAGKGVPAVTVTLRDESGQQTLAEGATDAAGQVSFTGLTALQVRLSVSGRTADGRDISLGEVSFLDDVAMLVRTDVGGPEVLLVMDDDGYVYVDPATMALDGADGEDFSAAPTQEAFANSLLSATPAAPATAAGLSSGFPIWALIVVGLVLTVGLVAVLNTERREQ